MPPLNLPAEGGSLGLKRRIVLRSRAADLYRTCHPEVVPATIAIADLRQALNSCLDACERRLGAVIDLDADYYWLIEPDEAFDMARQPDVNAGQLIDDLEAVRTERDVMDLATWHDLGHLLGPLGRLAVLMQPQKG